MRKKGPETLIPDATCRVRAPDMSAIRPDFLATVGYK